MSAMGSIMQMQGQMQAADAAKRTADYNANLADMQAKDAINRGNIEAEKQRMKTQQIAGAQRAAMGSSGAQVDSGSFGDILLDTSTMGEKDAQSIRTNALRQAWGLESQASMDRYEGAVKRDAGYGQATGTLLTGASSMATRFGWDKPKASATKGS